MARSKFSDAPIAPRRPGYWLGGKLRRQGRQDAKKYMDAQDYTRTHALIQAQSKCQSGQHEVNQWFIKATEPLISGNARLEMESSLLSQKIAELKAKPVTSERLRRSNESEVESLVAQLTNLKAQRNVNNSTGKSLTLAAEEALKSWESHYQLLAGVYLRAKIRRSKNSAPSSQANVPLFESIPMAHVEVFDELAQSVENSGRSKS